MSSIVPALPHARRPRARLDLAGAVVSTCCALHCAAAPLLLAAASAALVPAPLAAALADERVEGALVGTAVLVAAASLRRARRRGHGDGRATALVATGFAAIAAGTLLEPRAEAVGSWLLVFGGACVALGHLTLRRRLRRLA